MIINSFFNITHTNILSSIKSNELKNSSSFILNDPLSVAIKYIHYNISVLYLDPLIIDASYLIDYKRLFLISISKDLGTLIIVLSCFSFVLKPYHFKTVYSRFCLLILRLTTNDKFLKNPHLILYKIIMIISAIQRRHLGGCSTKIDFVDNQLYVRPIYLSLTNHYSSESYATDTRSVYYLVMVKSRTIFSIIDFTKSNDLHLIKTYWSIIQKVHCKEEIIFSSTAYRIY
ncbi:hypothetical protein G7K_6869-t1 [Saitoella complicata NRRL Y-17804]|uniref:Uncharacterized protein n=1 Tax=Saitoella complicata (strain BCRC 22490 / CBS 7301 / JCM 7358 / NBRC 10748 / NRRL Y-17804) TaxID=698492 RepID=A0A0E9NSD0_SAICN|nr:hypothetical protein G7K_6869-t1 [Saitoella complicata NRRL Y-17804]